MPCPEYIRLRTEYEAALRRWGDVLLAQPVGRLVGDVKRALCEERSMQRGDERAYFAQHVGLVALEDVVAGIGQRGDAGQEMRRRCGTRRCGTDEITLNELELRRESPVERPIRRSNL